MLLCKSSSFLLLSLLFSLPCGLQLTITKMQAGIRFLIASDVHLGHKEKHAVRGEDSFKGFSEVIDYAKERKVDFLLLGGDLFDEVNPSKECYFKCLSILREHVFGNVGSTLRVSLNGTPYRSNLDDPGLRVSLPIFTIHGNHDYPTNEFGKISACDLLQASNYVNYFGKHLDLRSIIIRPLIINKPGSHSRIALYGLGYIKDQILNQLFSDGKVTFQQPQGGLQDTLCLFVLHQNRYKKSFRPGSPLHQSFNVQNIPQWMGLVIWGHEHEAIYKLEEEYGRKIYQPGSTILTSYIQSECGKKQCLLIEVAPKGTYDLISLPLNRSFRPMKCLSYEYAILKANYGQDFDLFACLEREIDLALREFQEVEVEVGEKRREPVIRVKVEVTGLTESVRARQVEMHFISRVANGEKILQFWTRRVEKPKEDDGEVLNKMRKKEIVRTSIGIIDEMDSFCRTHLEKAPVTLLPKEGLMEMTSYISRNDSVNPGDIIKRKCQEMAEWRVKAVKKEMELLTKEEEDSFQRALKYYLDRTEYYCSGVYDLAFYSNCPTPQEFIALRDTLCSQAKYAIINKTIHEKTVFNQQQHPHNHSSKGHSVLSGSSSMRVGIMQGSVGVGERSDSEDCCSRAEKTEYDETGNKMRYLQAQDKMKKVQGAKLKRPANINPPKKQQKQSGQRSEQKNIKQVRFSNDFM